MKPEHWTAVIHLAGAALTITAFVVNATLITDPTTQQMIVAIVVGLWGKLGGKPLGPVLDRIVEQESSRIARIVASVYPPPVTPEPPARIVDVGDEALPTAPPPAGRRL